MSVQKDPEGEEKRRLEAAAPCAGKRVIEIGCGDGRLTWKYARPARLVAGIDLDAAGLRYASIDRPSDLEGKAVFARASSLNLPFPAATFDLALLAWSL
jgi:ubiquinone/menaquinone biosynthesis C-methylase UbiE